MTPSSPVRENPRRRRRRGCVSGVRAMLAAALVYFAAGLTACGESSTSPGSSTPTAPTLPSAAFTYSPASPLVNQSVQFSDGSAGTPTSWSWDFGDGGTSAAQHTSHAFATAGSFTVTLMVRNAAGSSVRLREELTSEKLADRVCRMQLEYDRASEPTEEGPQLEMFQ